MIRETKDKFVVEVDGRCYGKYRSKSAALAKEFQVRQSQQPSRKRAGK